MFANATVSSRSSSSRSGGNHCSRNSSMPSLRLRSPLSPKTSYNPLFRHSDAFSSFDASNFLYHDNKRKERKAPILRRYNSHDSHSNLVDVKSSSNYSADSIESGTAVSSPNSTGDRKVYELEARDFLERYSLPRVVRVADGEPLVLYRCFDSFTKVQAKGLVLKRGKEKIDSNILHFPEGYPGWFSLINEKGEKCAVAYSSVLQLVREQVCSFISIESFTAYTGHSTDVSEVPGKVQYLKTTVRGGQIFQLRAVFQHKDGPDGRGGRHSTKSSRVSTSRAGRDKDLANRYAQLINQNNQELYVPLTTKGEFYEIHSSMKARLCFPGLLDKTGPLALDKDCLYKITHLLRRTSLPLRVKLLAGPLPSGLPKDFTDTFILENKFQEPLMVACTLPSPSEGVRHELSCISLNSNVKISKCMLGFDSESRLFKSQRLQAALTFCHKNVELWYREVRIAPDFKREQDAFESVEKQNNFNESCVNCAQNLEMCAPCKKTKDTNENSDQKQIITKDVLDKFPKSKKWYKNFKILGANDYKTDKANLGRESLERSEKVKSIERYKDMSKLIEEKFGKKSSNPVKKSASFMFSTKRLDEEDTNNSNKANQNLLKCQSLDNQLHHLDRPERVKTKTELIRNKNMDTITSKSSLSDSYDFQMCILHNDNSIERVNSKGSVNRSEILDTIDVEKSKKLIDKTQAFKKNKPDLIPTLTKENSFITERLCTEFHVKTKVQKQSLAKASNTDKKGRAYILETKSKYEDDVSVNKRTDITSNPKTVVVQVHEVIKSDISSSKISTDIDDIPYSQVADKVCQRPNSKMDENIYAEICENKCSCGKSTFCDCKHTKKIGSEYCYVKLGSNGESITSDSDEAIYNTLR